MTADTPARAIPEPALGRADARLMARIFQHPMTHNLSWREILALFHAIGTVQQAHDGASLLRLNGQHQAFKSAHEKDLDPEDVVAIRHLLTRAGWAGGPPVVASQAPADLVVVIDHDDARIYAAHPEGEGSPQELHHVQHQGDRTRRDADRDELWPDDTRFFAEIAQALAADGRIVVVGHGTGQSNEAGHLMAYLAAHHAGIHGRVVREITTDLAHQTLRQLLAVARDGLVSAGASAG